MNQGIDDQVSLGASYADAMLPDDAGGAKHNQFISGWLTTSHLINGNTLKSSFIWGQARADEGPSLNSFLEEAIYQWGRNNFYGRAEILQLTPKQLEVAITGGAADAKWVKALTAGYERTLFEKDKLSILIGAAYTTDLVPAVFRSAYGSDLRGIKGYLRIKFMADGDLGF